MPKIINAVIFDLGGVLIKESRLRFGVNLNFRSIVSLLLKNGKLPTSLRPLLFKELHKLDDKDDRYYPDLFYDWLIDKKSGPQVDQEFRSYLEISKDIVKSQKVLLEDISEVMFDSRKLANIMNKHSGIKLLKYIIKTHCKVYLVSNYNSEAFDHVTKRFPRIFYNFDGIIVSGKEHIAKPNSEIYKVAIERWNLDPGTTLYIDDEQDNVDSALKEGMDAIKFDCNTFSVLKRNFSFIDKMENK